jgi:hypothetical protein
MNRYLACAITAKLADDQRPGFHHPLDQDAAHRRTTGIPKMTKLSTLSSHDAPQQESCNESGNFLLHKQNMCMP